ncbi:MAG: Lin1244/Lin1753 domain-containing protein [Melioribacteraceae bacterium]
MGRVIKTNAVFFFHDADASSDEKILYLESKYGTDGYAFYFKMLEALTRSNNFELHFNAITLNALAMKFGIEAKRFKNIITDCLKPDVGILKKVNGAIYSVGLKKRMEPLMEKRLRGRMLYEKSDNFGGRKNEKVNKKNISATEMTHKRREDNIREENREEEKRKDKSVREEKRGWKNGSEISRIIIRS